MPGVPLLNLHLVDVRDVARAHIIAMTKKESDGERIILCHEKNFWLSDISNMLAKEFGPQGK